MVAVAALVLGLVAVPAARWGAAAAARPSSVPKNALRVVGFGDSVMSAGACRGCTSYLTTAARRIAAAKGRPPAVWNYARGGYNSRSVLAQLRYSSVRAAVRASDVVVIEIGANDFSEAYASRAACLPVQTSGCYYRTAANLRNNLTSIVSQVWNLQKPSAEIVLMGYWNVFKDGEVGEAKGAVYVENSDQLTRWVNSIVYNIARSSGARYADAYGPFKATDPTRYLVSDGDHPNAAGHAVLAGAVVKSLG